MIIHLIDALYEGDYRISLTFNDGATGIIDFSGELRGEIFAPLKDRALFRDFRIEGHTIAWENGADFAPEYLHALLTGEAGVVE